MEQLKRIKGVRGRLKSSLTKLLYTAENSSASIGVDVEVLLVRPDKVWNDFELAGDDLSVLDVEGWVDPADDYGMYEAKYLKARALLFSLKRSQKPTTPTTKRHAKGDSIANNDAISRLVQQQQEFFERLEATLTPTQAEAAAPVRETELPKIHIKPFGGFYKMRLQVWYATCRFLRPHMTTLWSASMRDTIDHVKLFTTCWTSLYIIHNIIDQVSLESFFQICLNFYFLNNKLADFFPQKSRFLLQSVPKNLKIGSSKNPPRVTWEKCLSNDRTLIF
ncbi:uncharacterized protein LOC116655082 isoform X1 [Drosophila ananassae]|uniref:uncharacterized protein LOC116655082 isoform X1 n=1 Tax=Drosophila ananassae TaxID=7217 RepID=UPI0013A5D40D|nr:uncharacterized protein LOC116655082 isoform X1 [Drosophila ananassae]